MHVITTAMDSEIYFVKVSRFMVYMYNISIYRSIYPLKSEETFQVHLDVSSV